MQIDTYTVGVKFDIDKASFRGVQNAMDKIQKQANSIGIGGGASVSGSGSVNPNNTRIGGLGGVATIGVGIVGANEVKNFFTSSIKLASDFEAKMTDANIILKGTEEQYQALSAKARELGATTSLTASDSAAAIEVLARNGVKYDQIMGGILDSTVNLALALKSDLAPTADLLTDITAQFGIDAKDAAKAADLLAGATVNSKFGFNDMRLAIAQAGGVAGKVGVEFDDFVAALAATSSAFSSGSDAGTSFKTFLQRLDHSTAAAMEAMGELGLLTEDNSSKFFDAAGNMKSMSEITQLLHDAFKNLSDEQKISAASTIAGTDAMRTMLTLAGMTGAEFDKLSASIDGVSTAEMRLAKSDTFEQKMKRLQSAWEAFKMSLITPDVLVFLGNLLDKITGIINGTDKLSTVKAGEIVGKELEKTGSIYDAGKKLGEAIFGDKTLKSVSDEQKRESFDKGLSHSGVTSKPMASVDDYFNLKSPVTQPINPTQNINQSKTITGNPITINQSITSPNPTEAGRESARQSSKELSDVFNALDPSMAGA